MIHKRMTTEEIDFLLEKYWVPANYKFPGHFEHRFEPISSAMMYALIRDYKPTTILAIGTWMGGSTCIIMSALLANEKKFTYVASEIEDDLREKTRNNSQVQCGQAPIMIGDITKNLDKVPKEIDFLFHDTNHDLATTEWVVKNIFPRVKKGALVIFHDWAVTEKDGEWVGKHGMWPETQYLIELHKKGELPFEKVYFNYELGTGLETGVFLKK